jgi:uncharacterized protein DUF2442
MSALFVPDRWMEGLSALAMNVRVSVKDYAATGIDSRQLGRPPLAHRPGDGRGHCSDFATRSTMTRIKDAKPLHDYRVQLTLTDGRLVERDLGPLLVGPIFEEIRNNEARFREMRVEGGTLVWPTGADLCPDVLIWGGLPPADAASTAA